MKKIKSHFAPRNVKITTQEYLMIYPACSVPRKLDMLFTRHGNMLCLDDPVADFLVGKFSDIDYVIEEKPVIPEPEIAEEVKGLVSEPTPEPLLTPEPEITPEEVEDIDDYNPTSIPPEPANIPTTRKKVGNDKSRNNKRTLEATG